VTPLSFQTLALAVALAAAPLPARAARPVARWDVVPDQVFEDRFQPGVCAFHPDGVKVEFRIGGTLVHTASEPTLNRQSGVWEFWFPLAASNYPDGRVTLEARAIPLAPGQPANDLPPLSLFANSRGTLSVGVTNWADAARGDDANPGTAAAPFRTLARAVRSTPPGGTVNLLPGSYSSHRLEGGSARPFWTTIQAAPGAAREAVEVTGGRPGTERLRWRSLSLVMEAEGKYATILVGENGKHSVWLDDCKVFNRKGRWAADSQTFGNRYVAYVTGGMTTEMANGPAAVLIRDHTIETISSDAWTGSGKLVVNSVCRDINPGKTGAHPDFHQSHAPAPGWCDNVILYNVRGTDCISQGLFGSRLSNAAFVNVLFEKGDTVMLSQYSGELENVLFLHLTIVRQSWLWREGFAPTGVVALNSIFQSMSPGGDRPGLTVENNHFSEPGKSAGAGVTTGDPLYRAPGTNDFRLQPDSPARGSGRFLQCVPADIDGIPHPASKRNRGCHADPLPAEQEKATR
jgi:hypothetical protein